MQHAHRLQARELGGHPVGVPERGALGDLQRQPGRREAGVAQDLDDVVGEVAGEDLVHGDVHRDAEVVVPGQVPPAFRGPAGAAQHLEADLVDRARLLGQRDEHVRGHGRLAGPAPPRERLQHRRPPRAQVDDRLEGDVDLAALDGAGQLLLQARPVRGLRPACPARRPRRGPCPSVFATYIAMSASRSSPSADPAPPPCAIPTLAPTVTWWPATVNGSCRASTIRPAIASASSGSTEQIRTANSSPPSRAAMSPSRTHAEQPPRGLRAAARRPRRGRGCR